MKVEKKDGSKWTTWITIEVYKSSVFLPLHNYEGSHDVDQNKLFSWKFWTIKLKVVQKVSFSEEVHRQFLIPFSIVSSRHPLPLLIPHLESAASDKLTKFNHNKMDWSEIHQWDCMLIIHMYKDESLNVAIGTSEATQNANNSYTDWLYNRCIICMNSLWEELVP